MLFEKKLEYVADNSTLDYCFKKTAEELFELGEVVMKQITKPNGANSEERINKLIEEAGDVVCNLAILSTKLNLTNQIDKRLEYKLEQCFKRIQKELENGN